MLTGAVVTNRTGGWGGHLRRLSELVEFRCHMSGYRVTAFSDT
jgi:hypothetical protein